MVHAIRGRHIKARSKSNLYSYNMSEYDIAVQMTAILGTMLAAIAGLVTMQRPLKIPGMFLPCETTQPSKRAYETFVLVYTPFWILAFACIVAFGLYETFDEWSYMKVCVGLALPFLLQPILLPSAGFNSPDSKRPLLERYAFKANFWIAVYSFIGNYWYTHCKLARRRLFLSFSIVISFSFSNPHFQTFTRCSKQSTPCQHTGSTMSRSLYSLPPISISARTMHFPT